MRLGGGEGRGGGGDPGERWVQVEGEEVGGGMWEEGLVGVGEGGVGGDGGGI